MKCGGVPREAPVTMMTFDMLLLGVVVVGFLGY